MPSIEWVIELQDLSDRAAAEYAQLKEKANRFTLYDVQEEANKEFRADNERLTKAVAQARETISTAIIEMGVSQEPTLEDGYPGAIVDAYKVLAEYMAECQREK
jgi:hypothetical protein